MNTAVLLQATLQKRIEEALNKMDGHYQARNRVNNLKVPEDDVSEAEKNNFLGDLYEQNECMNKMKLH